jgi:hypothetical protein
MLSRTRCPLCKRKLEDRQRIHPECVEPWAAKQEAKAAKKRVANLKKAKAIAKKVLRERKAALVPFSKLEERCREIVQAIARLRDRDRGCISCEKPANWQGQWHGSHYRTHAACSSLQFHLWNINRACWICNKLYSGRVDQQKVGIVERYGQERLDWLNAQPKGTSKHTPEYREYLERFKKVMGKRLRRMEKRIG